VIATLGSTAPALPVTLVPGAVRRHSAQGYAEAIHRTHRRGSVIVGSSHRARFLMLFLEDGAGHFLRGGGRLGLGAAVAYHLLGLGEGCLCCVRCGFHDGDECMVGCLLLSLVVFVVVNRGRLLVNSSRLSLRRSSNLTAKGCRQGVSSRSVVKSRRSSKSVTPDHHFKNCCQKIFDIVGCTVQSKREAVTMRGREVWVLLLSTWFSSFLDT